MSKIKEQFLPESVRNRKDLDIRAGDTVRVNVKIQEKGKTRIQTFEGLVLARKHGSENGGTFTVRKISKGIGVERIFPLYAPSIDSIEILRRAKVRRSKLYFLRDSVSKKIRYKLRRITNIGTGTNDLPEWINETPEEVSKEDLLDEETVLEEGADAQAAEEVSSDDVTAEPEETPEQVAETEEVSPEETATE